MNSKIHNGKVHTIDGLKLEQFTKNDIRKLFEDAGLKVEIFNLNKISYMCVAENT